MVREKKTAEGDRIFKGYLVSRRNHVVIAGRNLALKWIYAFCNASRFVFCVITLIRTSVCGKGMYSSGNGLEGGAGGMEQIAESARYSTHPLSLSANDLTVMHGKVTHSRISPFLSFTKS